MPVPPCIKTIQAEHSPPMSATLSPPATGALAASLRARHVAMIALGGVVGAGLFVGSSAAIATAGPAVLLSYAFAGLIVWLVMRMLGAMAIAEPGRGSHAGYAAFGLGRWAGFVTGWLYWYFWVVAVGAETVAGASLLAGLLGPAAPPVWLLGLVLIAAMTAVNLLSVRAYGEFEYWFSLLKVAAIGLFITLGLAALFGAFGPEAARLSRLAGAGGLLPLGLSGVAAAVPVVIFSLTGSEIATIAAAESDDPPRNVARAARTVALRIATFYLGAIALVLCIVAWPGIRPGHSPFVTAMQRLGIPGAADLMTVLILIAVLSCLNSGLYVTSRMMFELAGRGDAPKALVAVGRSRVPVRATLAGASAGFLAAIASIVSPDGVFAFLVATSGTTILFVYALIAAGYGRWRRAQGMMIPLASAIVLAGIAGVCIAMSLIPAQRPQFLLSLASLAVAGLGWGLRRRFG